MWREEHKHLGREPQFCLPPCPLLRLLSLLIHPGDSFPSRPGLGLGPQSQGPRSLVPFPQYPNCVTLWDSVSNVIIKAVFGMASWGQGWPLGMVFAELPPGLAQHRGFTLQHGGGLGPAIQESHDLASSCLPGQLSQLVPPPATHWFLAHHTRSSASVTLSSVPLVYTTSCLHLLGSSFTLQATWKDPPPREAAWFGPPLGDA